MAARQGCRGSRGKVLCLLDDCLTIEIEDHSEVDALLPCPDYCESSPGARPRRSYDARSYGRMRGASHGTGDECQNGKGERRLDLPGSSGLGVFSNLRYCSIQVVEAGKFAVEMGGVEYLCHKTVTAREIHLSPRPLYGLQN